MRSRALGDDPGGVAALMMLALALLLAATGWLAGRLGPGQGWVTWVLGVVAASSVASTPSELRRTSDEGAARMP